MTVYWHICDTQPQLGINLQSTPFQWLTARLVSPLLMHWRYCSLALRYWYQLVQVRWSAWVRSISSWCHDMEMVYGQCEWGVFHDDVMTWKWFMVSVSDEYFMMMSWHGNGLWSVWVRSISWWCHDMEMVYGQCDRGVFHDDVMTWKWFMVSVSEEYFMMMSWHGDGLWSVWVTSISWWCHDMEMVYGQREWGVFLDDVMTWKWFMVSVSEEYFMMMSWHGNGLWSVWVRSISWWCHDMEMVYGQREWGVFHDDVMTWRWFMVSVSEEYFMMMSWHGNGLWSVWVRSISWWCHDMEMVYGQCEWEVFHDDVMTWKWFMVSVSEEYSWWCHDMEMVYGQREWWVFHDDVMTWKWFMVSVSEEYFMMMSWHGNGLWSVWVRSISWWCHDLEMLYGQCEWGVFHDDVMTWKWFMVSVIEEYFMMMSWHGNGLWSVWVRSISWWCHDMEMLYGQCEWGVFHDDVMTWKWFMVSVSEEYFMMMSWHGDGLWSAWVRSISWWCHDMEMVYGQCEWGVFHDDVMTWKWFMVSVSEKYFMMM